MTSTEPTSLRTVHLDGDNTNLANFCGPLDENLRQIANAFDAELRRRGSHITVEGPEADQAAEAIQWFYDRAVHIALSVDDVQLGLVELKARHEAKERKAAAKQQAADASTDDQASPAPVLNEGELTLRTRRRDLRPRTERQRAYLSHILNHDISFGVGPAGTGKTFLAVACAIDALERESVQRIVLTRPAVEAGERLGFLPGDLAQKIDPYLRPLYDALYDLMGYDKVQKLFEKQIIEIAPLAYMRGRTLNHSFVILDEAQNTTVEQMKMLLTRIGFGSKAVITGDPTQVDLPKGQRSGLAHSLQVLEKVPDIAISRLTSKDVVRHPLVGRIIEAYEKHNNEA